MKCANGFEKCGIIYWNKKPGSEKKVSLRVLKYADMFRRVIVSTDMNSRVQNNGNVTSAEVCKLAQSQTRFFATEVWQWSNNNNTLVCNENVQIGT